MLSWIREKFGTAVISTIIGLIAVVFIFFGVFSPKATRGLHDGAVAGKVNGDAISIADFQREYNRRIEFFKNMAGGTVSDEQLKMFRVRETVFQDLVRRKLLVQEAERQGLSASTEEVKQSILEIPAFQKEGKFDLMTYKQVLSANNLNAGGFERMMKEDLSAQRWGEYFSRRVHATDEEVKRQYLAASDRRNIKYVLLTTEAGKKGLQISDADIQKFLADSGKLTLAKNQFEAKKDSAFKGQTFEGVKNVIARELLAGEKLDEVKKVNEKLAGQVLPLLKADKGSDAKVNALLKSYGVEVKSTGMISRQTPFVPGIGEARELLADAFAKKSPIDPAQGGQAKTYSSAAWMLVAVVSESQKPDLAKFETERPEMTKQVIARKQREMFESWMKGLVEKASVDANPAVVGSEEG